MSIFLNNKESANVLGDNHSHSFFFYDTDKYTIVPFELYEKTQDRAYLNEVCDLSEHEIVKSIFIEKYSIVLVYVSDDKTEGDSLSYPLIYLLLIEASKSSSYNKLVINLDKGVLNLVLAEGDKLLLSNTFDVSDYSTAFYYILMVLKDRVINPALTKVSIIGEITEEFKNLISKYFRGIVTLSI